MVKQRIPHGRAEEKHFGGSNTKLHCLVFHKRSFFPPGSVQCQKEIRTSCSRSLRGAKPETQGHPDSLRLSEWAGNEKLIHMESRAEVTGLLRRAAQ